MFLSVANIASSSTFAYSCAMKFLIPKTSFQGIVLYLLKKPVFVLLRTLIKFSVMH